MPLRLDLRQIDQGLFRVRQLLDACGHGRSRYGKRRGNGVAVREQPGLQRAHRQPQAQARDSAAATAGNGVRRLGSRRSRGRHPGEPTRAEAVPPGCTCGSLHPTAPFLASGTWLAGRRAATERREASRPPIGRSAPRPRWRCTSLSASGQPDGSEILDARRLRPRTDDLCHSQAALEQLHRIRRI